MHSRITKVKLHSGWKRRRWPIPKLLMERHDPLLDLIDRPCKVIVEVGSQWGWWAARTARDIPEAVVYCVDPWADTQSARNEWGGGKYNLDEWMKNVEEYLGNRIIGYKGTSEEIAPIFDKPIDFLFIDADHHEKSVLHDLRLWIPKVRKGGFIAGHDWGGPWKEDVRAAVRKYFRGTSAKIESGGAFWAGRGRDLTACWWTKKDWE